MMEKPLFGGVNVAILTPMREDLSVDLDRLVRHARWLLAHGATGIGVLGTTGEANSLGLAERIDLLEGVVARGIPAETLLPGVGTPAIPDTVLLLRKAAELGCRGALVLPPFFYKNPSEEGLFAYFAEIIERAKTPPRIYLYHFPAQSAVPFTLSLVGRLLEAFPGVIKGIKDSSGDFANTEAYVRAFAAQGFEVYCGDDGALHALLQAGGAGGISAASNLSAPLNAEVVAHVGTPRAEAAQAKLTALRRTLTVFPLIPALKALMARLTGDAAWRNIRPPFRPLGAEDEAKLFAAFDALGYALPRLG
jgi:4-hydroxy-tetrahydrodipicolinate synthase